MTNRKFTPPTSFPAEYVDGNDNKAVILGRGPDEKLPFIGYGCDGDPYCWTEHGEVYPKQLNRSDLYDIPKRIEELEAKLTKAVEALVTSGDRCVRKRPPTPLGRPSLPSNQYSSRGG